MSRNDEILETSFVKYAFFVWLFGFCTWLVEISFEIERLLAGLFMLLAWVLIIIIRRLL